MKKFSLLTLLSLSAVAGHAKAHRAHQLWVETAHTHGGESLKLT